MILDSEEQRGQILNLLGRISITGMTTGNPQSMAELDQYLSSINYREVATAVQQATVAKEDENKAE